MNCHMKMTIQFTLWTFKQLNRENENISIIAIEKCGNYSLYLLKIVFKSIINFLFLCFGKNEFSNHFNIFLFLLKIFSINS